MTLSPPGPPCGPPEELQELAFIERPIRRSLKTAEEIDQLTVDEDLNDVERAVFLLRVDDTRAELLPELLELAGDEESSVRLAAFDSIISLMEMMDGGSLSDEQKRLLLQKFQVLCITGLPTEENRMDVSESTLIRCNCCYNLPVLEYS
ncbi:hypothetical protein GOODEAATRI_027296 [Goodea atripinnis]|uniref:Uncharacterized protein n=1 Tax=Goodea atripinnis TaxID=208336 RepID=A0ABV0P866_9TELE